MKVLFTSIGRRVELIKIFKKEGYKVYSIDSNGTAPGLYFSNKYFISPKINETNLYIDFLINIIKKEKIDLIIPLIDFDLLILSKNKKIFKKYKCEVLISDKYFVENFLNKYKTYNILINNNFLTPKIFSQKDDFDIIKFPIIAKPKFGYSSIGIFKIYDKREFRFYLKKFKNNEYIYQELIRGEEITVDVLIDKNNTIVSCVQRQRLKTRGGEVERGKTVKYNKIFEIAKMFVKKFKPFGVINIQFIKKENEFFIIEVNPRFGGGFPLSYNAGANFPKYIKNHIIENRNYNFNLGDDYIDNYFMLRFDNAIYGKLNEIKKNSFNF